MAINTETKTLAADGATLTGDQVVVAVEEILMAEGFGLAQMVARPNQFNGSVATFKLPERKIPEAYARSSNGLSQASGPVIDQVDITTNQEDIVATEFEDMAFATQVLAEQEKARIANSMVAGITAHLDLEFLDLLNGTAVAPVATGFEVAADQNALATSRLKLGDVVATLESTLSPHELGVSASRQVIVLSPKAYLRYINSFDTNVLEQSTEIKSGNLVMRQIGGALIVKHPLVGKNIKAGDIHKTKAVDMATKKIEGFAFVDVAAALPINFIKSAPRINENFNQEIGMKYKFGKGLLRDALIVPLVSEAPAAPGSVK